MTLSRVREEERAWCKVLSDSRWAVGICSSSLEHEGMQATGGTPEAFGKRIRTDYDRWVKLVESAKIVLK